MWSFMKTQSAAFYLRTAPVIDNKFKAKYSNQNDTASARQIAIGVRKRHTGREVQGDPFEEEEKLLKKESVRIIT